MDSEENHAVTEKVIGLAMRVHRTLGPGFLESVYLNALTYELRKAGLEVGVGQRIKVRYGTVIVGDFVADLVVAGNLICELKAISCLTKGDEVQVVLDVGDGDVGDGAVQHHHELGHGDDDQRDAEVPVTGTCLFALRLDHE